MWTGIDDVPRNESASSACKMEYGIAALEVKRMPNIPPYGRGMINYIINVDIQL